ncbi:M67 family metallopeptidase [Salisaeta longa]|uniref:M67 family metallopeptidase n=1 Tax=Salisaeta longa TaxID=503170 RepID=UPI0003B612B9|nr:M67 family metallopeptidase [Salisaeta longa]
MLTTDAVLDDIRAHGADAYPEEGCGFLLGQPTAAGNHVVRILPVTNRRTEQRERRYEITAEDYRDAAAVADAAGLDVVGFYHSHPDHPARPSTTDLDEATFPGYTYVIVSVQDGTPGDLTAWTLAPNRSRFEEESIADPSAAETIA